MSTIKQMQKLFDAIPENNKPIELTLELTPEQYINYLQGFLKQSEIKCKKLEKENKKLKRQLKKK